MKLPSAALLLTALIVACNGGDDDDTTPEPDASMQEDAGVDAAADPEPEPDKRKKTREVPSATVTVTAETQPVEINRTPNPVKVVDSAALERLAPVTVTDLLKTLMPGQILLLEPELAKHVVEEALSVLAVEQAVIERERLRHREDADATRMLEARSDLLWDRKVELVAASLLADEHLERTRALAGPEEAA